MAAAEAMPGAQAPASPGPLRPVPARARPRARRQSPRRAGNVGILLVTVMLLAACGSADPLRQRAAGPSAVPVGDLVLSVWLPAGLGADIHLGAADQQQLTGLGINQLQWLQRATGEGGSAEAQAMAFASRQGLSLPVYYEPAGFSPYDKLHNWAARTDPGQDFDIEVARRAAALLARWGEEAGFGGYLVGHEDYRAAAYDALGRTVRALRGVDSLRPAIVVGRLDSYPQKKRFLEALFVDGGEPNIFQHEHYIFTGTAAPAWGPDLRRRVDALVAGYDAVARRLRDRHGRWHAVIQVHGEDRDGQVFYRKPSAAEIRLQAGLALARGASGVVYFLYSSGEEILYRDDGSVRQRRHYHGLVDRARRPGERYAAVRALNATLNEMSAALAPLYFRGGYEARRVPADEPVHSAAADCDIGLFGDLAATTHALIINRRTDAARTLDLTLPAGSSWIDAVSGELLAWETDQLSLSLAAGGMRLLARRP